MPLAYEYAHEWQKVNLEKSIGQNGKFSTTDHRWLWASHGSLDMCEVWPFYYSEEDYARCCKIKAEIDPNGVFTPNTFVVGYEPSTAPENLAVPVAPIYEADSIDQPKKVMDDAAFTKGHKDRAKRRARAKGINLDKHFR